MNGLSADVSIVPKENQAYLLNPGKGWITYSSFSSASTAAWAKACRVCALRPTGC